ncbi:hypothetical protein [Glutamicibacter sp.]|uniref:hypothetical protein n=1 Tax=Glutamicibacter sp. TaxID=1931995 RepID=UPI002FE181CA
MAKKIDLRSPKVREQKRQVATYGTQTPLSSTAVERGSTRWLDGSRVDIEGIFNLTGTGNVSGRLNVGGTLDVTGTFNGSGVNNLDGTNNLSGDNNLTGPTEVSGSLDVTGPTNLDGVLTINGDTSITGLLNVTGDTTLAGLVDITGDTTITGQLDVDGPTTISGTLGIEGETTLKNDLNVTSGGKITAGNLEIEPANGGQINFTGGSLSAGQFGALLNNLTAVELQAPTVRMRATTTEATGQLKVNSTPIKAASQLTPLGIDSNGVICRIG